MIQRLAPWQRINVAIARGLLLQPSNEMKWIANIFVDDIKHGDTYSYFPVAGTMDEAAREVAKVMAKRLYGDEGEATFVNQLKDQPLFMANIGIYQGAGVTKGRSLSILLREYRGVQ